MIATRAHRSAVAARAWMPVPALLAGLAGATALRMLVGGGEVRQSLPAALWFGGAVLALALAAGARLHPSRSAVLAGLLGGVVLCLPPAVLRLLEHGTARPGSGYAAWAAVVLVVATAEELLLRGALFAAVASWQGEGAAIVTGAVAFAALHLPLYGIGAVPLDLAVGLWLGALRSVTGSVTAPAVAHVTADLVGWWIG